MEKDLQRIELKVLVDAEGELNLDPLLTIFDRWRQDSESPSDWVDLADYAHMPKGPGVMMAGKRENFALDLNDPGPGIFFSGKKDFSGSLEERFLEAFRRFLTLAAALVAEQEFPAEFRVRPGDWEVVVNDRLDFPNTDESDRAVRPGLEAALDKLFGRASYSIERESDPQRRLGYSVRAQGAPTLSDLLARASGE